MRSQKGFTLIEIMIVLAILGAVVALVAPRFVKNDGNIKTASRHFLVLSREVRTKARLMNSTYRIAFSLDPQDPKYWVERANGPQPVDPLMYEEEQRKKAEEKKEDAPPPLFQIDKSVTRKEQELPSGLYFGSVETTNMKSPITSGTAYVHFFPEGFVEAAAVQITNGNNLTWTLVFNPLTGQADIIEKATSLKDVQR